MGKFFCEQYECSKKYHNTVKEAKNCRRKHQRRSERKQTTAFDAEQQVENVGVADLPNQIVSRDPTTGLHQSQIVESNAPVKPAKEVFLDMGDIRNKPMFKNQKPDSDIGLLPKHSSKQEYFILPRGFDIDLYRAKFAINGLLWLVGQTVMVPAFSTKKPLVKDQLCVAYCGGVQVFVRPTLKKRLVSKITESKPILPSEDPHHLTAKAITIATSVIVDALTEAGVGYCWVASAGGKDLKPSPQFDAYVLPDPQNWVDIACRRPHPGQLMLFDLERVVSLYKDITSYQMVRHGHGTFTLTIGDVEVKVYQSQYHQIKLYGSSGLEVGSTLTYQKANLRRQKWLEYLNSSDLLKKAYRRIEVTVKGRNLTEAIKYASDFLPTFVERIEQVRSLVISSQEFREQSLTIIHALPLIGRNEAVLTAEDKYKFALLAFSMGFSDPLVLRSIREEVYTFKQDRLLGRGAKGKFGKICSTKGCHLVVFKRLDVCLFCHEKAVKLEKFLATCK